MQLFIAIWNWLFRKKPKRSKLLTPLTDPRFEHPAYKNIPEELLLALGNPSCLRNPPYSDGYYGLISGEFCMRRFQSRLLSKIKRQTGVSPEEYRPHPSITTTTPQVDYYVMAWSLRVSCWTGWC
jgi:conjugal transfer pilus assembly protein TraI